MGTVSFTGLASGLDTAAIVSGLLSVEKIPLQRLQQQNSDYSAQKSIINNMSSALSKLSTASKALSTIGDFLSYKGTSSDESAVKITASGDSTPGDYSIKVTQLASAQKTYSNEVVDKKAALSGSNQTLTITIDGDATEIDIAANSSLESVASAINDSGANVTAGIFYDGTKYRLQVVGKETGASQAITFADSGLGLGLSVPANTIQTAKNALLKIDNYDVVSESNTVSEALPGVSLQLLATTGTDPETLKIQADTSAVKTKLQAFATAYNDVFSIINAQVGQGKDTNTLNGDSTIRTIEAGLQRLVSGAIPGLTDGNGEQMVLADLGFKTGRDGKITLDSTKLEEKLAKNFAGAARYFTGDSSGETDGISGLMDELIKDYTDSTTGLLTARTKGIDARIKDNENRITQTQTYLDKFEQSLKDQFTALEQIMSGLKSQQQYLSQFLA